MDLSQYAKAEDGRTRVVILPPSLRIYQLGASAVTTHEVPEWSRDAERHAAGALDQVLASSALLAPVALPELGADERAVLDEHLALAYLVAETAWLNRQYGGKAFDHKRERFDYMIGDGLAALRERSGADLAVLVAGRDEESTGGRATMGFLIAVASGGNSQVPPAQTAVFAAVIDLRTGAILWSEGKLDSADFREPLDVYRYVDSLVCSFPSSRLRGDKARMCARKWLVDSEGIVHAKPARGGR
jgi:hypothetical protein